MRVDRLLVATGGPRAARGRRRAARAPRSSPAARQNVFFSCAPQASTGRAHRRARAAIGRGHVPARAAQQHRRARRPPGATESSQRVTIARSWVRKRSAMSRSLPSASRVLEDDRLVGEVARGHHQRPVDLGEQQVVERRVGEHQADQRIVRRDLRRHRPPEPPPRPARWAAPADSSSGASSRRRGWPASAPPRGRAPSPRTASRRGASARGGAAPPRTRWRRRRGGTRRGPSPRRSSARAAPRPPRRIGSVDAASFPVASSRRSRGPQRGQALGWAWKRRSAGSSYSRWQVAHIANAAIVVAGRS